MVAAFCRFDQAKIFVVVPACGRYNAGMQYTIRQIPKQVDQALRAKAKAQKKSLNEVTVEAIQRGLGLGPIGQPKRDLSFMGGMDDETARAIEEAHDWFDRVWPEEQGK